MVVDKKETACLHNGDLISRRPSVTWWFRRKTKPYGVIPATQGGIDTKPGNAPLAGGNRKRILSNRWKRQQETGPLGGDFLGSKDKNHMV
jgi:hypothetical protein